MQAHAISDTSAGTSAGTSATTDDKPLSGAALNRRIQAAELAVVQRDERVRATALAIAQQTRQHAGRLLALGGVGLGSALLFGLLRPTYVPPVEATSRARPGGSSLWSQALALMWPLLPLGLRSRASPAMVTLVSGLVLPIAGWLFRRPTPVLPAAQIDLRRFAGRWYELAHFPHPEERRCAGDATTRYLPRLDGSMDVVNRCRLHDGQIEEATGVAKVVRSGHGSRLKVSFAPVWLRWVPGLWSDLWILGVDGDYDTAVIGSPDRRRLWLLARRPAVSSHALRELIDTARRQGFDTSRLSATPHSG